MNPTPAQPAGQLGGQPPTQALRDAIRRRVVRNTLTEAVVALCEIVDQQASRIAQLEAGCSAGKADAAEPPTRKKVIVTKKPAAEPAAPAADKPEPAGPVQTPDSHQADPAGQGETPQPTGHSTDAGEEPELGAGLPDSQE